MSPAITPPDSEPPREMLGFWVFEKTLGKELTTCTWETVAKVAK
jgi:hypothetical protein